MGLLSSSKSKSTSITENINETLNQQNIEGQAGNVSGDNSNIIFTDFGAIQAGMDVAESAISGMTNHTTKSIDAIVKAQDEAFNFSGGVVSDSMRVTQNAFNDAYGFGSDALKTLASFAGENDKILADTLTETFQSLANTQTGLATVQRSENAAVLTMLSENATKVVFAGIAAIVLYKVLK